MSCINFHTELNHVAGSNEQNTRGLDEPCARVDCVLFCDLSILMGFGHSCTSHCDLGKICDGLVINYKKSTYTKISWNENHLNKMEKSIQNTSAQETLEMRKSHTLLAISVKFYNRSLRQLSVDKIHYEWNALYSNYYGINDLNIFETYL